MAAARDSCRRLREDKDTKIVNCNTYIVDREDHTLGNVLRMYGCPLQGNPNTVHNTASVLSGMAEFGQHPSLNRVLAGLY